METLRLDPIDRMIWSAVLRFRRQANDARVRLGLAPVDYSDLDRYPIFTEEATPGNYSPKAAR